MGGAYSQRDGGNTVSFAHKLAESPRFKTLFRDGMTLVEEVAAYLDGAGRAEAKALPRSLALAYAAESMRLTTRLMQLASWLLVQRAVNEGEMTQAQADAQQRKVELSKQDMASGPAVFSQLPDALQDLTARSLRLQTRLVYLDRCIRLPDETASEAPAISQAAEVEIPSVLGQQWEQLRSAFAERP